MSTWKKLFPDFLMKQWDHWFKKMENALIYFTPTYVTKSNSLFSPLIAVTAIIIAICLIGMAIGSFFTLFASLLVLYFILNKVFGIRLDAGDVFVV